MTRFDTKANYVKTEPNRKSVNRKEKLYLKDILQSDFLIDNERIINNLSSKNK